MRYQIYRNNKLIKKYNIITGPVQYRNTYTMYIFLYFLFYYMLFMIDIKTNIFKSV